MQKIWKGWKTVSNFTTKKVNSEIEFDVDKLNEFYARFDEGNNREDIEKWKRIFEDEVEETPPAFSEYDAKTMFSRLSGRKSAGPDGVNEKLVRVCANKLRYIYTYIFNMSILISSIPSIWKT